MSFRLHTKMLLQASRNVAAGIFIVGLILTGFGFMIYLLPKLFATLAAMIFFITGAGCIITAVRIFFAQKKLGNLTDKSSDYRKNVRIHTDDHFDI